MLKLVLELELSTGTFNLVLDLATIVCRESLIVFMVGLLVNVNLNDFSSPPPPPLSVPSAFVLGGPDVSLYTIFSIIFGEVSLVLCNVVKEFNGIEIALSSLFINWFPFQHQRC